MTTHGDESLVHFVADCTECEWHTDDYIDGQRLASAHAIKTGHKVIAEAGYAVTYKGAKP